MLYLQTSISKKNKHILVEGKDDKYLIERLCKDFLSKNDNNNFNEILVDSAEYFIKDDQSSSSLGNREKVELIANSIVGKPYANDFVGFVDRELHKFAWDHENSPELQDNLNSHEVLNRLVLSRGHSIENYVFELSILCETLEFISTTPYVYQAIDLFKETLEPVLRIACSAGLAATKAQLLSKSKSTIDNQLIEIIAPKTVNFKFDEWINKLVIGRQIQPNQEQDLRLHYNIYTSQVANASIALVRWICHGHIGYEFIKALYERCILEVCPDTEDKNKELQTGINWVLKDKIFHLFINYWIKKIMEEKYEYPLVIFELLGISAK